VDRPYGTVGFVADQDLLSGPITLALEGRNKPLQFIHAWEPEQGLETDTEPNRTVNYWSWGFEEALPLVDSSAEAGYFIRYGLRLTDQQWLLGHCIGSLFEPYYQLLIGRDYGNQVRDVYIRRWPNTMRALYQGLAAGPSLVRVQSGCPVWLVACYYEDRGGEPLVFPLETQRSVWRASRDVLQEIFDAEDMNISLIPIVAGDRYWVRQLKRALEATELVATFFDGRQATDVIGDSLDLW
jgi:hypothetical protein